ncbi:hypothetical protein EMCG_09147 [[Emmonsia] crescens]|uniref:PH domain-containing protein n=1 Tax=[Emmonsia] crescens TaxID=73230 RepID=A0A0G2JA17_9EURO|nr:hypothetical protein EMCG_09147 [Emmonsia crescens UAMH 3008]
MAARSRTPLHDAYATAPDSTEPSSHVNQANGSAASASASRPTSYMATPASIVPSDFQVRGGPVQYSTPVGQVSRFHEDMSSRRGSSIIDGPPPLPPPTNNLHRSDSQMSATQSLLPSRASGTLKKKPSLSKKGSLRRGGSRRSSRAGSVRSMALGEKEKYGIVDGDEVNSAFYVPIPTSGSPTDVLAARFQAWRKVLKDLIMVFREIQKSYEIRSKTLLSVSNSMNNVVFPPTFLATGGISDATKILKEYHRQALVESAKARDVELEVIKQLTGLRSDLQQKIKEIKSLSGDFKNSVDKEVEGTRKAVRHLQEALGVVDTDPAATSGKGDPFLVKCAVHRQLEKQIDEENYLHRAFLNLENSGRELERIVVTEIQKTYNMYANILKRDADAAYDAAGQLIDGPISVPQDYEWDAFVSHNDHLVDPLLPLRTFQHITYPGKNHPAAAEVRAGMLERKSKYLKSYTPGWYVLSPTHLHEYKSADRIEYQNPVMSLYLPEQKLGSHSQGDSASHKFMLKGRQTGAMHRGHAWVFRAESHDTMLEWYNDIKNLTEKTGEDRNAFVRKHARTLSGGLYRAGSVSSEGAMDEDEADETPYSADHVIANQAPQAVETQWQQRPQPGGRFPSDIQLNRNSHATYASSRESSGDHDPIEPATANTEQTKSHPTDLPDDDTADPSHPGVAERQDSNYVDWMAPVAATAAISSSQKNTYSLLRRPSNPDASIGFRERTISPPNAFRGGKAEALSSSNSLAGNGASVTGTTVSSITNNIPYSSGGLGEVTPLTTPTATVPGSPKTIKTNSDRSRQIPTKISEYKLPGQYPTPSY